MEGKESKIVVLGSASGDIFFKLGNIQFISSYNIQIVYQQSVKLLMQEELKDHMVAK